MGCNGCGKKGKAHGEVQISQFEACRECNYTVTACCLIKAPAGFAIDEVIPPAEVAYNLDLNCNVNNCELNCTISPDQSNCEGLPITTSAVVQQVILTGAIDFVVNVPISSINCPDLEQSAVACCEVNALVDNPVCIFPEDAEIINCNGSFCPSAASIETSVELNPITICGEQAYEANITLTFVQDEICQNFLVQ